MRTSLMVGLWMVLVFVLLTHPEVIGAALGIAMFVMPIAVIVGWQLRKRGVVR